MERKEAKETNNNVDELVEIVKSYLKTYLDLATLRFVDKLSLLLSKFFYLGLIVFFAALAVLFLLLSLGLFIGEVLGSNSLGFLSMSGLSLVIIVFYIVKPARGQGIYKLLIRFFAIVADNDEGKKS